jgi:hypothetical protein
MAVSSASTRLGFVLVTCLATLSRGEQAPAAAAPTTPLPFVLHLNGIGGKRSVDQSLHRGLEAGGLRAEVQFYDWTHGDDGIGALQRLESNRKEAKIIADMIVERFRQHPGSPIYITCHSGGAGLAAWALEQLPDDVHIEQIVMFAPALSKDYDLSKALRHVRKNCYVFSSPFDNAVLSIGTKIFGTIDGVHGDAGGYKGFERPQAADEAQYAKIIHQPYDKDWLLKYGNAGSHICAMRSRFAREYVAPLLLGKSPTTRPVDKTANAK